MKKKQKSEEKVTPFTAEEKRFLGDTDYRWIGIGIVSYDNTELTTKFRKELEKRGFKIHRTGLNTTVFRR